MMMLDMNGNPDGTVLRKICKKIMLTNEFRQGLPMNDSDIECISSKNTLFILYK